MGNIECAYNLLLKENPTLPISIKRDQVSFPDCMQDTFINILGPTNAFAGAKLICGACHQCRPKIRRVMGGVKIERGGYNYIPTEQRNLLQIDRFEPIGISRGNLTIFDDSKQAPLLAARFAQLLGVSCTGIQVDTYAQYTKTNQSRLEQAVLDSYPYAVIGDKGIGFLDGITLLRMLRTGTNTLTIMYTGEPQTDETRKVAQYFVMKPNEEELIRILNQHFPLIEP